MAVLDDKDSRAMADLLAKLRISSLEDLRALIKPKKVKKEWQEDDDDDGGSGAQTTVVPKLIWFSDTTPVPKGHVSFTAWKHEVEGLTTIYSEKAVIQAIKRSL